MCFSPQADFAGGALVAVAGAATLRQVRAPRELIVGSLPLLFGAHQFIEGFVWLGLRGQTSAEIAATAREAYIVFAHAVLPALIPLGFVALEPDRRRARWLWPLAAAGLVLGAYLLHEVTAYPVAVQEQSNCIDYITHTPNSAALTALYVLVTCGPALVSSRRCLRWFGALNLVGVTVAAAVRANELTSVWCVYAAFVSVLIYIHFRRSSTAAQQVPEFQTGDHHHARRDRERARI
jgi:hypothetical protein